MRVLVVDNDSDIRLLLSTLMRRADIEAGVAASGPEALEMLAADPLPDIVLLDIQMPDVDGYEILASIRADPRTHDVPVVICTVKGHPGEMARGWELGCDGFVAKPFDNSQLIEQISAVAARNSETRAALRKEGLAEARRRASLA